MPNQSIVQRLTRPGNVRVISQQGLSLVELMVAMSIGLVLLTILATVFANSSRSQKEVTMAAQQVENGRYATEILGDDLRHAGYYGYFSTLAAAPTVLPDPCLVTVADIKSALALPVQGYSAISSVSCIASANYVPGTDILVVRHASTLVTAVADLDANKVYIQSRPSATAAFATAATHLVVANGVAANFTLTVRDNTGAAIAAPIRQLKVHIYFVAPCSTPASGGNNGACSASADGGSPIRTLKRLELTSSGGVTTLETFPLVEGIENFQVEYGIDTDSDGAPNSGAYVTAPSAVADWQNVMAMRVFLLAINTQASPGYIDNKTYVLGTTTIAPAGDNYRRHVYSTFVRLKNPSERREPAT